MIRQTNKLILVAVLGGMIVIAAVPAEAGCHGRSGGGSYGSGYSRMSYHPVYSSPVYSQPVYSRPVYSQPVYSQPAYAQPGYGPPQTVYGQTQPMPQFGPGQPGYPPQQGFSAAGQTAPQGAIPPAQFGTSVMAPGQGTPMTAGPSQMVIPGAAAPTPSAGQAGGVQIPNGGSPVNASPGNGQQSAVQALGGFAPPQNPAAAPATAPSSVQQPVQTQQPSFAGTWTANLANGARIQLSLLADGTFNWTAVNQAGQSSNFQGTYTIENGSLSLTRGNDSQNLSGSVTTTGTNTFNFRLSVDPSSGIDFVRG